MKRLATLFSCSSLELKQVRTVTICAMMAAIGVALGSVSIFLGSSHRIGFSEIPNMLVCYLFGPMVGGLFAGTLDILKYLIKPMGAFFPPMTLVVVLKGILYGCFFYKAQLSLRRVAVAQLAVAVSCNLLLNTLCLSAMYGTPFMVLLPPRIIQNLIMWVVNSLVFFYVAKVLEVAGVFRVLGKTQAVRQAGS